MMKAACVTGRPPVVSGAHEAAPVMTGALRSASAADPDTALVAAVAKGDAEAARRLMERHLPKVLNVARRMLGDATEAEDISQEVFLRVWKNAGRWRPGRARFETWIHRVTLNLCYDRLRRRREITTDAPPERMDDSPNAFDVLRQRDVASAMDAALAQLSPRQRAALILCHYQEKSNGEAAEILDVSVEALESLLARGRRALRERLREAAPDLLESQHRHQGESHG